MPKVEKKDKKANPLLAGEGVATKAKATEKVEVKTEISEDKVEDKKVIDTPKKEEKPVAKVSNNAEMGLKSDIEMTRIALSKEPQVNFMIPLSDGEKVGATHDCFINGYKVTVPKGRMCIIPQSIANLLAETYRVQAEAGSEFRLDFNDDVHEKLS